MSISQLGTIADEPAVTTGRMLWAMGVLCVALVATLVTLRNKDREGPPR